MLKEIKQALNNNPEIKESLQGCSDDLIFENASLIYKALSNQEVFEGYKIKIWYEDNEIKWDYAPVTEGAIKEERMKNISSKYTFKLPLGHEKLYLTDLNQVTWTEDKKQLATSLKILIKNLEESKATKGFWLCGPHNSGKSFAMLSMLNTLADKNITVSYVPVTELVTQTQGAINNHEGYSHILENINRAKVIVIDDLGVERSTPWFKENILLPILEYRSMADKVTIFSSNTNIESYASRLKFRSQSPETEEVTNDKIIARIKYLINKEMVIG